MENFRPYADTTAVGTAILSFFELIPWAEIAAFLSAAYLVVRIYFLIKNRGKD